MFGKKKIKKVRVGNYELLADRDHRIEEYLDAHEFYSRNLPRIARLMEAKYPKYSIIDIGANIGDTVALFRSYQVDQMVYCVEGDPGYYELLQQNAKQFKNVQLFRAFLGEETATATFEVDKSEGTAKLNTVTSNEIRLKKLDDLVKEDQLQNVKLLKIDTDGFDLKIIRGGLQLIEEQKPVIFFEFDAVSITEQKEDGPAIFKLLKERGYNKILFYDNYGRLLLPVNADDETAIQHLYRYTKYGKGAFEYYDVCVFHDTDSELCRQVIEKEGAFFD